MLPVRITSLLSLLIIITAYWQRIEAALLEEAKVSRLSNNYTSLIADKTLLSAIQHMPIRFSSDIPNELQQNVSMMLRTSIYQRINHEVLHRILALTNFSCDISQDDELLNNNALTAFQQSTNTLKLTLHAFVDEVWVLQSSLAMALTYASLKTVIERTDRNFAQVNNFLALASAQLDQDWRNTLQIFKRLEASPVQIPAEYRELWQQYRSAISNWHPQLEIIAPKSCDIFREVMHRDFSMPETRLIAYSNMNATINIFAPKNTQPFYSNGDCPALVFYNRPSTQANQLFNQALNAAEECLAITVNNPSSNERQAKKLACVSSLPSKLKKAYFPMFCQLMTEKLALTKNYCSDEKKYTSQSEREISRHAM